MRPSPRLHCEASLAIIFRSCRDYGHDSDYYVLLLLFVFSFASI